jgi:pyruvate/2-oxoglutarate dehydrogenase complex dihydrolipoamide acyltransferase (E2) component
MAPALSATSRARLAPASPKAHRLASERGKDIAAIEGKGPEGAVLTADVLAAVATGSASEARPPAAVRPRTGLDAR